MALATTIRDRFERRYNSTVQTELRRVADEQADAGLGDHEIFYATIRFLIRKGLDPTEYIKQRDKRERQRLHLEDEN